jgi:hypothetical protein
MNLAYFTLASELQGADAAILQEISITAHPAIIWRITLAGN